LPLHEPLYPLTAGLTNTTLRKAIGEALGQRPTMPEWIDPGLLAKNGWPSFSDAVVRLHAPEGDADLLPSAPARPAPAYSSGMPRFSSTVMLANGLGIWKLRTMPSRVRW